MKQQFLINNRFTILQEKKNYQSLVDQRLNMPLFRKIKRQAFFRENRTLTGVTVKHPPNKAEILV
jgi:hypothetical protein